LRLTIDQHYLKQPRVKAEDIYPRRPPKLPHLWPGQLPPPPDAVSWRRSAPR
jgi:hypothetical protein